MTNEKLIDDAVTAFADREITPPSRDDLRIALDAYEASLTRCGCDDCTTARRERNGLGDHDRTTVARALHEIVYSPGAVFDRAVPGIQEHMLACADKVAAALPWIRPAHTPTDDGRIAPEDGMTLEELGEAISNYSPLWDGDEAMHAIIYRFLEHYAALDAEVYAARESTDFEEDAEILFRYDHETATLVLHTPEPQGEPSDTLDLDALEAAARAATPGPWMLDGMGEDGPEINYWAHRFIGTDLPQADGMHQIIATSEDGHGPNAEYIAAADPTTVLALIAALRAAGGDGR